MKKALIICMASLALLVGACNNNAADEQQAQIDSLQTLLNDRDGQIDELFDILNQIEDNLNAVTDKYSHVQNLRNGDVEGSNVKGEIKDQITTIESMLADNKAKLATLNSKIAAQGKENTKLSEFVARLEEQIANQEQQISQLVAELEQKNVIIAGLNDNVNSLTKSNQEKDATIARQVEESNKAYFVVASANELIAMGIASKSGGFLGMGRKTNAKDDMNIENFTCIDRTRVTTIQVNKRGATVLSKHPADSYELVMDESDSKTVAYIKILNPTSFWRYTSYLVVSTK
ncbi:MAG: hypothetical protein HUK17_02140 [Bacteroidales bacterium]|nr:hypothetical protein [Bacteroidales bacterium]